MGSFEVKAAVKGNNQPGQRRNTILLAVIGGIALAAVLIFGTVWMGQSARKSTEEAVHSVSNFYLQELAERREQVVVTNLNATIKSMRSELELMSKDALLDMEHLQAWLVKRKRLYELDKFAFVDSDGLIYTSRGTQDNIDDYSFDYLTIDEPEIFIKDLESDAKKVVIAVPADFLPFGNRTLVACFLEIDMEVLLEGLALQSDANSTTFCNLYNNDGTSLTSVVLGGLSDDTGLMDALAKAEFDAGHSLEQVKADFLDGQEGVISFTYDGTSESMYYVPVLGTDWMLTYLIRESIISEQINATSRGIITRSLIQTVITTIVLLAVSVIIIIQNRRAGRLLLEKETAEAESRITQKGLQERLWLQEQLLVQERQNETMHTLHDMLRSGPWYMDFDEHGNMIRVTWTDTFRRMIGYEDAKDFPNRLESWSDLLHPDDKERVLKEYNATLHDYTGQRVYDVEYQLKTKDRGWRWFHAVGQPTRRDDGSPVTYLGIFMDITEQKAMEKKLAEQQESLRNALAAAEQANAAKTSFLSSMSHEIRTPMNAIIGLDSIALKDPDLPERTREQLEKIGGSAKHLLSLINDILDMSRIESGRMTLKNEEFSFREMLEQINTMINGQCQDNSLAYECHINGKVDDYYIGDAMKLKQVIINILGNAVKFTPAHGTVSFTVEPVSRFEDKATLRFIMKDTGVGMDPAFLPKIFDAFSQEDEGKANKYGSTGLGMAITKSIVEMMNGKISVESKKGAGSTFTVTVTLKTTDRKNESAVDIRPQDMRVLIIDDDPVACEHAKLVLEEVGIVADSCFSGKEALERLRVARGRREAYNLILVDLRMPDQDGLEVTRQIRELYNDDTTIIILTAYSWDDIVDEAIDAGVDSFMSKPLFASGVLQEFRQILQRKNLSPAEIHKAELDGRHILLAEDMLINAEIMKELLKMRNMIVDHAENGQITVDMFSRSEENYYDAVLMDVRMPVMNGLEATEAIRALDRPDAATIPIIAMTANAFDEDVQRSLQAGMNAHLSKPVEPEHLFETLELLIKD